MPPRRGRGQARQASTMYGGNQQQRYDNSSNYNNSTGSNNREQYSGSGNASRNNYSRSGNPPRNNYSGSGGASRDNRENYSRSSGSSRDYSGSGNAPRDNYSGSGNAPRDNYSGSGSHGNYGGGDTRDNYTRPAQEPWAQPIGPPASKALSDLDLELEMLKRKRQMIQEQRQMMEEEQQIVRLKGAAVQPWDNQRQFGFEPQQPQIPLTNIPSLYIIPPKPAPGNQRGTKRAGKPQPWASQPQAKRFAVAAGGRPQLQPYRPQNLQPLLNQNIGFTPPMGPRPTRGKAPLFQGKSPNLPAKKITKLSRESERDVGPIEPPRPQKVVEMPIFKGIDSVSRSINGRFESAVGTLTKDIKTTYEANPHKIFFSNVATKVIKQRLRERIHKMLMNKPVPLLNDILLMYRKIHPVKGDRKLVFAVRNMADDEHGTLPPAKPPVGAASNVPIKTQTNATPNKPSQAQAPEKTTPNKPNEDPAMKYIKQNINLALSDKLDEIFQKLDKIYKEEEAAIADKVKEEQVVRENTEKSSEASNELAAKTDSDKPAEATENEAKIAEVASTATEGEAATEIVKLTEEESKATNEEVQATGEVVVKVEEPNTTTEAGETPPLTEEERVTNLYNKVLDSLIKRKLVMYLPKYKNFLISVIGRDKRFAKYEIEVPKVYVIPERRPPLHFVKVFGKPSLPPRQAMQSFLSEFEPASVKKHKSVYNLLFVGVRDLKSHQRLLDKTNCMIGDSRLIIRDSPNKELLSKVAQEALEPIEEPAEPPVAMVEDFAEDVKIPGEAGYLPVNQEATGENSEATGENSEATGGNPEIIGENSEATGENPETTEENAEATGETVEASVQKDVSITEQIGDLDEQIDNLLTSINNESDGSVQNGAVKTETDEAEIDEEQAEKEAENENEADNEEGKAVEVKAPSTPASNVRPRRSRRI